MIEELPPSDWKNFFASSRLVGSPRHHRDAAALGDRARPDLIAEQLKDFGTRTDEGDPRGIASAREVGILAQKAIAGVNSIASGFLRDRDDPLGVEICSRASGLQRDGSIGLARVQRMLVVIGVNRDCGDAEFGGRTHYADRDLTSIGDQKIVQSHVFVCSTFAAGDDSSPP